jgi:hypothetical protein
LSGALCTYQTSLTSLTKLMKLCRTAIIWVFG